MSRSSQPYLILGIYFSFSLPVAASISVPAESSPHVRACLHHALLQLAGLATMATAAKSGTGRLHCTSSTLSTINVSATSGASCHRCARAALLIKKMATTPVRPRYRFSSWPIPYLPLNLFLSILHLRLFLSIEAVFPNSPSKPSLDLHCSSKHYCGCSSCLPDEAMTHFFAYSCKLVLFFWLQRLLLSETRERLREKTTGLSTFTNHSDNKNMHLVSRLHTVSFSLFFHCASHCLHHASCLHRLVIAPCLLVVSWIPVASWSMTLG